MGRVLELPDVYSVDVDNLTRVANNQEDHFSEMLGVTRRGIRTETQTEGQTESSRNRETETD